MEQRLIRLLEDEMEVAINETLERVADQLPFEPKDFTRHAMAKAAVTVYEAVADSNRSPKRRD